jgi:threonine dehydratase
MTEGDVRLKLETLQPSFSYKIRGAFNVVLRLIEAGGPRPTLVTASAGNHGRALGHAAAEAGLALTVYAPEGAPQVKLDAIRRTGAVLRECRDYDDAERQAKQHAASGKASYISAYAHLDVIAGAGTVGLEILEEWPDVDDIVVPIGGGGLISGIAVAAEGSARTSVIGVEVEASAPFTHSIEAGRIVEIDVKPTLADGLAGNLDPDTPTFDIVRRLVRRIHVVSESHLEEAIRGIAAEERLIVEAAGAAAVAALVAGRMEVRGRNVAVVLSGANIDLKTFRKIV